MLIGSILCLSIIMIHNRYGIFLDIDDKKLSQFELTETIIIVSLNWISLLLFIAGLAMSITKFDENNKIIKNINKILKGKNK